MKIVERIAWGRRAVAELRGIRRALDVIAELLEVAIAPEISSKSAFRSFYNGSGPEDDSLRYMDDEDRAEMERREEEARRRGGPAVDDFYEGDDDRVGVVGPTVSNHIKREKGMEEPEE